MKKSNSTKKAQSAFLGVAFVLLIALIGCNQTGGTGGGGGKPTPPPTPKPKHAITFSVDSTTPNGTLKAKVEDIVETETSPINVEEDKAVTFIATANDGYKVKGWTLDGNPIAEAGTKTEYKHKVTAATTVKVSFESNSNPPTPQTKYTVTLNKTEGGKVTASPEIPADKKVLKDTVITFTAEAKDGYKIGKWTVTPETALQAGTGADGSETAKVKITADTTVSVSFELSPVEGGASLILSPDNLTINVGAKTEDGSDIAVEGCEETTLKSDDYTELHATGTTVILKGKITWLSCYKNQLTALNVQGCASLQLLTCWGNELTALDVSGLTALKELSCSDNKLTELKVQGCTSLQKLECSVNQLTALNVQGLTSLQGLYCSYNKLPKFNVSGLPALQELWCNGNQLSTLDVRGLTSLRELWCNGNKLNAQTMTEILKALPARKASDDAWAFIYTEETGEPEGNHKDYNTPADLKKAFEDAKKRNWTLQKRNANGDDIDI